MSSVLYRLLYILYPCGAQYYLNVYNHSGPGVVGGHIEKTGGIVDQSDDTFTNGNTTSRQGRSYTFFILTSGSYS